MTREEVMGTLAEFRRYLILIFKGHTAFLYSGFVMILLTILTSSIESNKSKSNNLVVFIDKKRVEQRILD